MYGYPAQEPPDVLASGQRAPAAPARVPGRAEPVIVSIRAARPALGHVIQADGAGRRHCEAHASRAEMAQVHLAHPFIDPHNTASLPSRRLSSRRTFRRADSRRGMPIDRGRGRSRRRTPSANPRASGHHPSPRQCARRGSPASPACEHRGGLAPRRRRHRLVLARVDPAAGTLSVYQHNRALGAYQLASEVSGTARLAEPFPVDLDLTSVLRP